ncbi:MAG TPA: site-2 protease family protein [Candidatus Acidoferrum sp.]|nr:site-2 protease family protein [Candidatus Acidoferrum sp.]
MNAEFLVLGIIWYVVFLFSTTCHEGAHALTAKLGGDPTAALGGQVSLNPIPHIRREPIGTIVVPIITYAAFHWMMGWASAPFDPEWQRRHPHRAAWMALAGPAANFALVIVAGIGIRIGMALGYFQIPGSAGISHITQASSPGPAEFFATLLSILFILNLVLGTFNLLPIPPLDGGTGVGVLMSEAMAVRFFDWTRSWALGFLPLIVAWYAYDKIFGFLFTLALNILYPGSHWS